MTIPEDEAGDRSRRGADDARGGDPLAPRPLRCRTVATGRLGHRHHIRDLPPLGAAPGGLRDPVSLLADDHEPNPSEWLLAALGSCLSSGIHANALARAIPIRHLEIELEGETGLAAGWDAAGAASPSPGFEAISVRVHIDADVPREVLRALIEYATVRSPVANTLYNPVTLDVSLA